MGSSSKYRATSSNGSALRVHKGNLNHACDWNPATHLGRVIKDGLQLLHPLGRPGHSERPRHLGGRILQVESTLGNDDGYVSTVPKQHQENQKQEAGSAIFILTQSTRLVCPTRIRACETHPQIYNPPSGLAVEICTLAYSRLFNNGWAKTSPSGTVSAK